MANNEYNDQVSPFSKHVKSLYIYSILGKFWGHYILAAVCLWAIMGLISVKCLMFFSLRNCRYCSMFCVAMLRALRQQLTKTGITELRAQPEPC